jgi:Zn finger protein HypA/HybF involved in hydrogenase expression
MASMCGTEGSETMICDKCNTVVDDASKFCPSCGAELAVPAHVQASAPDPIPAPVGSPVIAPAEAPIAASDTGSAFPSLYRLACPKCGSGDLEIKGTEGSLAKAVGVFAAFGAVGNLVMSANAEKNLETKPIKYKCNSCSNKFTSMPLPAQPDEFLDAPCTISFERVSNFVGMAVAQIVYLNGIKIGPIKNGKTITFSTVVRYNTLFVTDAAGVAFKGAYRFEAQPGGNVHVRFNRKFS